MVSSLLRPLAPELLYLFVLGPGYGESVLIRIPPDTWIVIDSFRVDGLAAACTVLEEYSASANFVVLTHPDQDHVAGFIDLIEQSDDSVIGAINPWRDNNLPKPNDAIAAIFGTDAKRTFDRIFTEWSDKPARRWQTTRGSVQDLPNGTIESLHPVAPTPMTANAWNNKNDLSSAMWLEWHDVRLLLGADVTNKTQCWDDISANYPGLANHSALKVPHHGSDNGLHASFGTGGRDRNWVITPYSRGEKLPSFKSSKGIEICLGFVDEVGLTSMHTRHGMEHEAPYHTTRSLIEAGVPIGTNEEPDCLERGIVIGFAPDGTIVERRYGRGTLRITE